MVRKNIKRSTKKKGSHPHVTIHISSSSNNTIMSAFSDKTRSVVAWSSPGVVGFKGAKKCTPYASQAAAEDLSDKMVNLGVKTISIVFRGMGNGRDSAVKTFQARNFGLKMIADKTGYPFNGTTLPRRRRV